MDLYERKIDAVQFKRHPWELSRLNAIRFILRTVLRDPGNRRKVLDIGCGDAFVSRELLKTVPVHSIAAIDTNLSSQKISDLSSHGKGIVFCNDYNALDIRNYDLILLLDVIEHVEDDVLFLREIADHHLRENGYMLMTAPAFQSIYSSHDRFLKHFRRYNRKEFLRLIQKTQLECLHSGYIFFSLLPLRFLTLVWEKLIKPNRWYNKGVGGWNLGKAVTNIIVFALTMDNLLSISLNRMGVRIPGLTAWVLCKKP